MGGLWGNVALHAALAAVFFFVFQHVVLKAGVETSVLWAIVMGIAAAWLSWKQNAK